MKTITKCQLFAMIALLASAPAVAAQAKLQTKKITAGGGANDYFGGSVSLEGNGETIVVGAERATAGKDNKQLQAGAAYVFANQEGDWKEVVRLDS